LCRNQGSTWQSQRHAVAGSRETSEERVGVPSLLRRLGM
jgi:hypothetical protein